MNLLFLLGLTDRRSQIRGVKRICALIDQLKTAVKCVQGAGFGLSVWT
jgi:hypothetical protein